MTLDTTPQTSTSAVPDGGPGGPDAGRALQAARAAAAVLPSSAPLTATETRTGTEAVVSGFAGAAMATCATPAGSHPIAVLAGQELVDALAQSPLGGLDLAAATQPALDAAAASLGGTAAAAATVDVALVVGDMGGPFTAVPLVGGDTDATLLVADQLLAPAAPVPVGDPATGAAPATASTLAAAAPVGATSRPATARGIEMLAGVDMEVTVELGRTRMPVRDLLALTAGTVLELDRAAGGPADLLVNGRLIARGEVVVVDENFGLRITDIVDDAGA